MVHHHLVGVFWGQIMVQKQKCDFANLRITSHQNLAIDYLTEQICVHII
jgi:hypothetical protein